MIKINAIHIVDDQNNKILFKSEPLIFDSFNQLEDFRKAIKDHYKVSKVYFSYTQKDQ